MPSVMSDAWKTIRTYLMTALRGGLRAIWTNRWVRRVSYASGMLLVLWIGFYGMAIFNMMSLNTYEEGWRGGNLTDYGMSNRLFQWLPPGYIFPTGEGSMLLGDSSSRNASMNGKVISPSPFSTTFDMYNQNLPMLGQPVAMHYRTLIRRWFLNGLTDVRVDAFEKLVPATLPQDCSQSHGWLTKTYANISGKIVEASRVGNPLLWKTNEIIVYSGGNEFKEMSIIDDRIFECAVMALKSGQSVRISYDDKVIRDPVTQATTYNLVGIASQQ